LELLRCATTAKHSAAQTTDNIVIAKQSDLNDAKGPQNAAAYVTIVHQRQ